ncbi:MAG: EF-hand domain-containing protein [Gammaproteobacteria bacterium]|nr:EF-hand domain-containing protein [Gammaproteobacteria bacterium]
MPHRALFIFLALSGALAGTAAAQSAGGEAGETYSLHDRNRDGYVDREEFQGLIDRRRQPDPYAQLWVFERVDADGDGRISGEEMSLTLRRELAERLRRRK